MTPPAPRLPRPPLSALLGASVVALVLAWPLLPLPMAYQVNDDTGLANFLAAGYDPPFFSWFLSRVLRAAHRVLGAGAPVYAGFLCLGLAACAAVYYFRIVPLLVPGGDAPARVWLAAAVHGALIGWACFEPTFTVTASLLGAHGLLLMMVARRGGDRALGAALLLAGMLVRPSAAQLTALFFLPAAAVLLASDRRRAVLVAGLGGALAFGAARLDFRLSHHAVDPEVLAFHRLNDPRTGIHGFPLFRAQRDNPALLAANGWTSADMDALESWLYFDEERFNPRTLGNFYTIPPPAAPAPATGAGPGPVRRAWETATRHPAAARAFLCLCALPLLASSRRIALALAAQAGLFAGLAVWLDHWRRLPPRVQECMVAGAALASVLLLLSPARTPSPHRARLRAGLALLLLYLGARGLDTVDRLLTLRWDQRENEAHLARIGERFPNAPVFFWPEASPPLELRHPLRATPLAFEPLLFGWTTGSQLYFATLRRVFSTERGRDVWMAVANRPDIVFCGGDKARERITRILRETYGLDRRARELPPEGPYSLFTLEPPPTRAP